MRRLVGTAFGLPMAGGLFVLSQVLRSAHRSDLPSFPNQDASGTFGDPSLPSLRIVAVGDSSLTGPGVEELDNIFIRRLVHRWEDRYHVELISLGVGGSKARDVIEGQLEEAVRLRPDIGVVSVCTNDALRGVASKVFRKEFEQIVARLEEAATAVVVIGMGDPGSVPRLPAAIKPYVTRRSGIFDRICVEVSNAHARTLKADSRGIMSTAFWEDRSLFAGDLFHAGDSGHGVFAEASIPVFDAALAMVETKRRRAPRRRESASAAD